VYKGVNKIEYHSTVAAFTLIKLFVKKMLEFSKKYFFFREQDFVKENKECVLEYSGTFYFSTYILLFDMESSN
jgi:hypothetical protein